MDREELERLIEEHGPSVYSFCCNLTGSRMEADDLYQDTFLKAFELRHRLRRSGNPRSFFMGIAVKTWQNHCRKRAGRQRIAPMSEYWEEKVRDKAFPQGNQPEAKVLRDELYDEVRYAVKCLPDKIRVVMYLFYTAEMPVMDIARILHVPPGTVKSRMHKGRNLVKQYLEVNGDGERVNG